jgi:hypothetical protein
MLNGLTGVSVILAMAVAGWWVGSYWRGVFAVTCDSEIKTVHMAYAARGRFLFLSAPVLDHSGMVAPKPFKFKFQITGPPVASVRCTKNVLGFGWPDPDSNVSSSNAWFAIPHWFLLSLTATLPSIRLFSHLRRKHLRLPGHCQTCGYDLRATPDRCPECGTVQAE